MAAVAPAAVPEVGVKTAPENRVVSGVYLLLRGTGWSVASSQVSSFIFLVFYFSVTIFLFPLTYLNFARRQLLTSFYQKINLNPVVGRISNEPVLYHVLRHQCDPPFINVTTKKGLLEALAKCLKL